jgi:NTE family protein
MREVESEVEWILLRAGEVLFEAGTPGDALYVAIHGRLEVVAIDPLGRESILSDVKPKESIGEMSLLTGEPRSATVRATRDSLVVRLSRTLFEALIARHPRVLMALTHLLVARLKQTSAKLGHTRSANVFAVVPASLGAPLGRFAAALAERLTAFGKTLLVNARLVAELFGRNAWESGELTAWLNEREDEHDFLILEADEAGSSWTERCIRHADHLLLLADAKAEPGELVVSLRLRSRAHIGAARRRELVLVHDDGRAMPSGTRRWLQSFEVDGHHHVRLGVERDLRRLARFVTGRAVALALGGGAARGAAHLGVIRALEEAGVPVDLVCGTSIGAVIASLYALGADHRTVHRQIRESLVEKSIFDFTVPVLSIMAAKRTEALFETLYGDTQIEDLWRKFFCVSSNLTRASVVVHRAGLLRRAVRASGALSGMFPPVVEGGELLVDGVLLNNLPADLVEQVTPCITIAVNLIPAFDETALFAREERTSPLRVLAARLNPLSDHRPPTIVDVLMRSAFLGTVSAAKRIEREVDLYIEPPLERFGFLDPRGFEPMVRIGHETGARRIEEWRRRGGSIPQD